MLKQEKKLLCRVCLQCDFNDVPASSIFDESDKGFIYENLNNIAEVDIKPGDGLPEKICAECLLELENAINFKQKCETSNSILVSAASARNALKGEEASAEDIKEEPDEYTEHEYLEEQPASPPELSLKPEEPDEQEQSPSPSKTQLKPPPKKSRAIDLQLECHDCGVLFKSKCKLKVHWFKVHLRAQLTCNICQRKFCSFKKLNEHKVNRTKKCTTLSQVDVTGEGKSRVMNCRECKYSTSCITDMTRHLGKHSGDAQIFTCKLCSKIFFYNVSLKRHMETKHDAKKIEKPCYICGEVIIGRIKYRHHLQLHRNKTILCKICNKLVIKQRYKQHMVIHSDEKNYFCDQCGASFKRPAGLYMHKKEVHGKENFVCDKCGYSNRSQYRMRSHQLKHTDKEDFACNMCGMFLPNDIQLTLHKKGHMPRNYKCLQCEDTFVRMSSLKIHVNKVHWKQDVILDEQQLMLQKKEAARKHKCPQCDAAYCRKPRLENHIKRVHSMGKKMYRKH